MAEAATILVYTPGSEVLIDSRVSGRVIGVKIGAGNVISYECVWWDDQGRHDEVLEDWEVLPDGDKTRSLRVSQIL
jgi:uncharacterized protein YodC (DUF2158 family)